MIPNIQSISAPKPAALAAAASALPAVDLKQEAQQEAAALLQGKPAFDLTPDMIRALCSLHSTTSIRGTQYEGGDPGIAFDYVKKLQNLPNFPIPHGLNPQQLAALSETTEELLAFDAMIKPGKVDAAKLKEKIKSTCQKNPQWREKFLCYHDTGCPTGAGCPGSEALS